MLTRSFSLISYWSRFGWTHAMFTGLTLAGCAMNSPSPEKFVDLTYSFDEQTVYWPSNQPFQWKKTTWGPTDKGYWYASGDFSASEHGGTHLDAPIHFAESGWSVDEIPVEQLTGEAIVLDVRTQSSANPDYTLQVQDILQWETNHGKIPSAALVLLFTGYGQYWPEKSRYLGSPTPEDPSTLHFPGFSAEAIHFLLTQRQIVGIGIDTASIDAGQSRNFPVHQMLGEANRYALENVAHLDRLPPRGARITALPMKIRGGTGGPVRIIATVP